MVKFEESLSLAKKAGSLPGVAHNLNEMAIIYTSRGKYSKGRELLQESLIIYRKATMKPEISKVLNNIAITYIKEHSFTKALDQYTELLQWDRKTENYLGVGITFYNMGLLYEHHIKNIEEAKKNYQHALTTFRKIGNEKYIQLVDKKMSLLVKKNELHQ